MLPSSPHTDYYYYHVKVCTRYYILSTVYINILVRLELHIFGWDLLQGKHRDNKKDLTPPPSNLLVQHSIFISNERNSPDVF